MIVLGLIFHPNSLLLLNLTTFTLFTISAHVLFGTHKSSLSVAGEEDDVILPIWPAREVEQRLAQALLNCDLGHIKTELIAGADLKLRVRLPVSECSGIRVEHGTDDLHRDPDDLESEEHLSFQLPLEFALKMVQENADQLQQLLATRQLTWQQLNLYLAQISSGLICRKRLTRTDILTPDELWSTVELLGTAERVDHISKCAGRECHSALPAKLGGVEWPVYDLPGPRGGERAMADYRWLDLHLEHDLSDSRFWLVYDNGKQLIKSSAAARLLLKNGALTDDASLSARERAWCETELKKCDER